MKPVRLKNFRCLASSPDHGELSLMPDLSIVQTADQEGFSGYAHWYKGAWLCFWANEEAVYMTHKGRSVDVSGCHGRFRMTARCLLNPMHRRFILERGSEQVASFDTSLTLSYFLDPTYDGIDFEADNFFAWVQYVMSRDDSLAFMLAQKPFQVTSLLAS